MEENSIQIVFEAQPCTEYLPRLRRRISKYCTSISKEYLANGSNHERMTWLILYTQTFRNRVN